MLGHAMNNNHPLQGVVKKGVEIRRLVFSFDQFSKVRVGFGLDNLVGIPATTCL
jgi:hypothetical protein